jgi:molecular chaperone GrpE (heat shock protein)
MANSNRRSLAWHRESIINIRYSLDDRERQLARLSADVENMRERLAFYKAQLAEADRRGMDGFDSDKLLVKRTPK